jgi:hypothetical protein
MGIPKRKTNLSVYVGKELTERRQELLDNITKSDTYLPDSILHDDLDKGFLDYVSENFKVVTNGVEIPIIKKILTIQRWGEFSNNWEFSNEDGNMELPFIAIIRKPDVQFGTNPSVQRTVPDRHQFYYASVPTWNGTSMGADVYKIPQPIAVDISYEVTIVCGKFRDLNKFNKKVMQNFSSRQDYTQVKGHYIPIVLDSIDDNSPIDTLDGRRFYMQNYKFTMLGFLIDSDEFEVKPAISRFFLMNEFVKEGPSRRKMADKAVDITVATFIADGMQTAFSVGESIGTLFGVNINGLVQQRDVDYFHVAYTSKITFAEPPIEGSIITISYYKGRNSVIIDNYGKLIQVVTEYYTYDGSTIVFSVMNSINSVVSLDINGLVEDEGLGFEITGDHEITLLGEPAVGSTIGITYLY